MSRTGPRSRRPASSSSSAMDASSGNPPTERGIVFESLESRLLFSATPVAALAADGILSVQGTAGADHAVISHVGKSADGGEIVDLDMNGMLQRFGSAATGVQGVNVDMGDGDDLVKMVDLYSKANVIGGAGHDALEGSSGNQTWNITGANSGSVGKVDFISFEDLIGAKDNRDTFVVKQGGSVSGTLDGGAGGFDTLVLDSGNHANGVFKATAKDSGLIDLDGDVIHYVALNRSRIPGL